MRTMVAVLAVLSLVAGLAGDCSARAKPKKTHTYAKAQARQPARAAAASNGADGYVERYADKLPFGSSIWWEQMLRENRAGTCCN